MVNDLESDPLLPALRVTVDSVIHQIALTRGRTDHFSTKNSTNK